MTTHKNSRRARARAGAATSAGAAAKTSGELPAATQLDLIVQLRRMSVEVEQLQSELAAVQALVTAPPASWPPLGAARPGSGWTPTPEAQPWLDARSA